MALEPLPDTETTPDISSNSNGRRSTNRTRKLTYRFATNADFELLKQYRVECGWGLEKLIERWDNPDWKFCVLSTMLQIPNSDEKESGESELELDLVDVGMGGWALDFPEDQETASRVDHTVFLSSLFIQPKYQGDGIGSAAMDLLERIAIDEFGAKSLTLDTVAYKCDFVETPTGTYTVEDFTQASKTVGWYRRRGYKHYRPDKPTFLHPTPEDPNRKLTAVFLKRQV